MSTETIRLIRDGEKGVRECGGGGRGRIYILIATLSPPEWLLHSDGQWSFNVSLIVRDKITRQCPQPQPLWRERTAAAESSWDPSADSLTPYRWATLVHGEWDLFVMSALYIPYIVGSFWSSGSKPCNIKKNHAKKLRLLRDLDQGFVWVMVRYNTVVYTHI